MKKVGAVLLAGTLAFGGCSSTKPVDNNELKGREFILVQKDKKQNITLGFNGDNYYGFSGVNNYFGKYNVHSKVIKFDKMGVTLMAGPIKELDEEKKYLQKLEEVIKYVLENDKLILEMKTGERLEYIENKV